LFLLLSFHGKDLDIFDNTCILVFIQVLEPIKKNKDDVRHETAKQEKIKDKIYIQRQRQKRHQRHTKMVLSCCLGAVHIGLEKSITNHEPNQGRRERERRRREGEKARRLVVCIVVVLRSCVPWSPCLSMSLSLFLLVLVLLLVGLVLILLVVVLSSLVSSLVTLHSRSQLSSYISRDKKAKITEKKAQDFKTETRRHQQHQFIHTF
jgi:hypothetical protein